jgi:GSH-dependent disulfide-bond oxidoreductase
MHGAPHARHGDMLQLYTWRTPNGRKVPILLAELGWRCELHLVDLGKNEQKSPAYLSINPNGKIPALVDGEVVIFESGAIVQYLADKASRFLPREPRARAEVLSWCWWQVGGPGPFFGQLGSFGREEPRDEHAFEKMRTECRRLAQVLALRLVGREWVAGEYSIADMMLYPWFDAIAQTHGEVMDGAEGVREWMARMAARPAVQQGMALDVGS